MKLQLPKLTLQTRRKGLRLANENVSMFDFRVAEIWIAGGRKTVEIKIAAA